MSNYRVIAIIHSLKLSDLYFAVKKNENLSLCRHFEALKNTWNDYVEMYYALVSSNTYLDGVSWPKDVMVKSSKNGDLAFYKKTMVCAEISW